MIEINVIAKHKPIQQQMVPPSLISAHKCARRIRNAKPSGPFVFIRANRLVPEPSVTAEGIRFFSAGLGAFWR